MRVTLTDAEFSGLRALLNEAAGLVFDDSRRDSLAYSIGERLSARGLSTVADYLVLLGQATEGAERQALLDEVTIQETHFFRNPPQVRALRQHVLPELIKSALARGDRTIRIWSAGCSTGEEPYTIAMMLRELLPLADGWDVKVIATDVSARALAAAREGRYGARALQMAEPADVARWFIEEDRHGERTYVLRPEARELVEFRLHNLVTEPVPVEAGELDLVLCRNVTIYFNRDTTRALIGRLHTALRDGGYLFLGHSETLWQVSDAFRLVTLGDAFVYRRLDPPASERRQVLPDRRTLDEGATPPTPERRGPKLERRGSAWNALVKPRQLPFVKPRVEGSPAATLATVRGALAEGRYEDAAGLAGELAERDVLAADAHYLRGLALTNSGKDDEALVSLRKAVYLDPTAGFAHFLLAGALDRLGQRPAAAASYRAAAQALAAAPDGVVAAELGGRSVGELVELCARLADRCEEEVRR
ncbi:MAG: chemotaxis protein methyltransferase CheR [Frankiaceae bacterium]|nr:chemotaxis protein methyltransferase CheR [Frankiaceae bacterium]MDX6274193.1 chemotaxis protein methyltransferase CheR [Frankiales bacterium]